MIRHLDTKTSDPELTALLTEALAEVRKDVKPPGTGWFTLDDICNFLKCKATCARQTANRQIASGNWELFEGRSERGVLRRYYRLKPVTKKPVGSRVRS